MLVDVRRQLAGVDSLFLPSWFLDGSKCQIVISWAPLIFPPLDTLCHSVKKLDMLELSLLRLLIVCVCDYFFMLQFYYKISIAFYFI